jgi:hypothetical protein
MSAMNEAEPVGSRWGRGQAHRESSKGERAESTGGKGDYADGRVREAGMEDAGVLEAIQRNARAT